MLQSDTQTNEDNDACTQNRALLNWLVRGIDRLADDLWGNRERAVRRLLRSGIVESRRDRGETLVRVGAEARYVERAVETAVAGNQELRVDPCDGTVVELGRVVSVFEEGAHLERRIGGGGAAQTRWGRRNR